MTITAELAELQDQIDHILANRYTIICHPDQVDSIQSVVDQVAGVEIEILSSGFVDDDVAYMWKGPDPFVNPVKVTNLALPTEDGVRS